jgi:hypothetical protein
MSTTKKASDWEALAIASIGGAGGLGGELIMFQFRSKEARFEGDYLFIGGGIGAGGSLNGAIAPSPADVARGGRGMNLWSSIKVLKPFSGDDLDMAYAKVDSASVAGAYGYSFMLITGGFFDRLFNLQSVSGWSVGVGINVGIMPGIWKRLGARELS